MASWQYMTENPESSVPPTTTAASAARSIADPNKLYQAAAWVVIVAGVVYLIAAAVFFACMMLCCFGHRNHAGEPSMYQSGSPSVGFEEEQWSFDVPGYFGDLDDLGGPG
jgi:hypothetical protein